jgi:hypothetical protein
MNNKTNKRSKGRHEEIIPEGRYSDRDTNIKKQSKAHRTRRIKAEEASHFVVAESNTRPKEAKRSKHPICIEREENQQTKHNKGTSKSAKITKAHHFEGLQRATCRNEKRINKNKQTKFIQVRTNKFRGSWSSRKSKECEEKQT